MDGYDLRDETLPVGLEPRMLRYGQITTRND